MINTKTSNASTTINPLIKIASHMSDLGYYAVSQSNYVKISYNIREYENYCVTLYDNNTNIDPYCTATPVILTERSDPHKYIIEKNGILYVSKYLGEDCICELLKYHLKRSDKDMKIRQYTTKFLLELGIPVNLKGYEYLKVSIELAVKNTNLFRKEIMNLYTEVAERCHTNIRCVERSIRTIIESVYYKNSRRFENFFGYPVGKPRNSELIGLIAERVRLLLE